MGSPPACAKCKRGGAAEGDSWCSGCIAVEGCTTALKGFWWSSSHRRLAESILVQASQQLRAVKNLDTTLQSLSDSWESKLRKAEKGGGKPPEPAHPPGHLGVAEVAAERRSVKEEREHSPVVDKRPLASPGGHSPSGGDQSSGSWSEDRRPAGEGEHPHPGAFPKFGGSGHPLGSGGDPRDRSRSAVRRRPHQRHRPGHRGGAKHQRKYREHTDSGPHRFHYRGSGQATPSRPGRGGVAESDL